MKFTKVAITGILISTIFAGCTEETVPKSKGEIKSQQTNEEIKNETSLEEVNDAKVWKDVSTPNGFNKYGIEPTLQAWITYHAEEIENSTDVDDYLPKINQIATERSKYFKVQGEDLEKDFDNLWMLGNKIDHLNFVISEQKNNGDVPTENYDQLNLAFKYYTELLHDLNIIINNDGNGETFGYTHQLDGDKVKEIESFIY